MSRYAPVRTSGWRESDVNAYRSELQGIYSVLLALQVLTKFHQLTSGSITLYCDNEKAVELANQLTPFSSSLSHMDLLRSIQHLHTSLPFRVQFQHVRGHQDQIFSAWSLSRPSQLNIACDHLAKGYLLQQLSLHPETHRTTTPLFGEPASCFLEGDKLTGDVQQRVITHCTQADTLQYLVTKGVLSREIVPCVNWSAIGNHLRHQPYSYRLWVTKHSHDLAATGRNMVKWGLGQNAACPCCGCPDETLPHLYVCQHASMVQSRSTALEALRLWMVSTDTNPDILHCFLSVLGGSTRLFGSHVSPLTRSASLEQDSIGYWNTLLGRLSQTWERLQQAHLLSLGKRDRSSNWSVGMVDRILDIGRRCWDTRNGILHESTVGSLNLHESRDLDLEIANQLSIGLHDLMAEDHYLITQRTLPDLLKLPSTHKRIWLHSVNTGRAHSRALNVSD